MNDLKRKMVMAFSAVAVMGATLGLYLAIHSPLFLVQVIEVADQPVSAPVDSQTITRLAAVPTGIVNLFDLDLKAVERRVLSNHWIKEVRLQKRFPQTLSIAVKFREPEALFQGPTGVVAYVDGQGEVFGQLNLLLPADLPLLSGFTNQPEDRERLQEALRLLKAWEASPLSKNAKLSTLNWDPDRGFRALIAYPMKSNLLGRSEVSLGQEIDDQVNGQLRRLSRVVSYLEANSISAKLIWADVGKKIVVKSSRRS